jgi:phosphoglycolate phosphatase-like HAD superfamily hydrolase
MFDFDNTIARLEPEVDWAGGRLKFEPYLRSVDAPADIFEKFPNGNLPLYDEYRGRLLSDGKLDAEASRLLKSASDMIEDLEMTGVDRAAELEGALAMLDAVRDTGAEIAIVTSNSSRTVERWFRGKGATIKTIVGRDTLLALKPAPEMVLRALELFSIKAKEAAFVGDSEADLLAARAAKVRFYGIASSDAAHDRLLAAGAEEIYASPAALTIHLNLSAVRR